MTLLSGQIFPRPNIHIGVAQAQDPSCMDWYLAELKDNGKNSPKAVIYCRYVYNHIRMYATKQLSDYEPPFITSVKSGKHQSGILCK